MSPYADLFFMGAAFLLLETSVATFALLFGTTWIVNALVFAGVLLVVLAAVETTRRFRTPPLPVLYRRLAASLPLAWVCCRVAAAAARRAPAAGRGGAGVRADLPGERGVRQAVRTDRGRAVGVRGTCSARCSAAAWSTRADDRLRNLLIVRAALPRGFPPDAQGRRAFRMTGRA